MRSFSVVVSGVVDSKFLFLSSVQQIADKAFDLLKSDLDSPKWEASAIIALRKDRRFHSTEQALERVVEKYTDSNGRALSERAGQVLSKAHDAFVKYAAIFLLVKDGVELAELEEHVPRSTIKNWLSGRIPKVIAEHDPANASRASIELRLTPNGNADRAFVLGAIAAVIRVGSQCSPIILVRRELETLEEFNQHLKAGFGIEGKIIPISLKGEPWYRLCLAGKEIVSYFKEHTDSNHRLPWENLITQMERRGYLSGYLSLTSRDKDLRHDRLEICKVNGAQIVEGLAVLFKREGIFARVNGAVQPSLGIYDPQELSKLAALEIVNNCELSRSLSRYSDTKDNPINALERFQYFDELRSKNTDKTITAGMVLAHLKEKGFGDLVKKGEVEGWIRGHKPLVIQRVETIEMIERKLIDAKSLERVGAEILARTECQPEESSRKHLMRVMRLVEQWHGDRRALALAADLPCARLSEILTTYGSPSEDECRQIFKTVGLSLPSSLNPCSRVPSPKELKEFFEEGKYARHFSTYQHSLLRSAREALTRRDNPYAAALASMRSIVEVSKRVNTRS